MLVAKMSLVVTYSLSWVFLATAIAISQPTIVDSWSIFLRQFISLEACYTSLLARWNWTVLRNDSSLKSNSIVGVEAGAKICDYGLDAVCCFRKSARTSRYLFCAAYSFEILSSNLLICGLFFCSIGRFAGDSDSTI